MKVNYKYTIIYYLIMTEYKIKITQILRESRNECFNKTYMKITNLDNEIAQDRLNLIKNIENETIYVINKKIEELKLYHKSTTKNNKQIIMNQITLLKNILQDLYK